MNSLEPSVEILQVIENAAAHAHASPEFLAALKDLLIQHEDSEEKKARQAHFIQGLREASANNRALQMLMRLGAEVRVVLLSHESIPESFFPLIRNGLVYRAIGMPDASGFGKTFHLTDAGKKLFDEITRSSSN